jgi:hypothetical protein
MLAASGRGRGSKGFCGWTLVTFCRRFARRWPPQGLPARRAKPALKMGARLSKASPCPVNTIGPCAMAQVTAADKLRNPDWTRADRAEAPGDALINPGTLCTIARRSGETPSVRTTRRRKAASYCLRLRASIWVGASRHGRAVRRMLEGALAPCRGVGPPMPGSRCGTQKQGIVAKRGLPPNPVQAGRRRRRGLPGKARNLRGAGSSLAGLGGPKKPARLNPLVETGCGVAVSA